MFVLCFCQQTALAQELTAVKSQVEDLQREKVIWNKNYSKSVYLTKIGSEQSECDNWSTKSSCIYYIGRSVLLENTPLIKFIQNYIWDSSGVFSISWLVRIFTATKFFSYCAFHNKRTLKFKAQPTNAFFATINQVFCGSSQHPTTAEHTTIESLSTVQTTKQCSTVVSSWVESLNIWLTVAKNVFFGWALDFSLEFFSNGNPSHWLHVLQVYLTTINKTFFCHLEQVDYPAR